MSCTKIFEFRNGTYITQVEAENVKQSVIEWVKKLKNEKEEVYQLSAKSIQEIEDELTAETPLLLNRNKNVWCLSFTIKKGCGLINIVKTSL